MLLTEEYYLKRGKIPFGFNGSIVVKDAIYIDPSSELADNQSTYPIKNVLKKEFGAQFSQHLMTWGWPIEGNLDAVLNDKVKPALQYLKQISHPHEDRNHEIEEILNNLKTVIPEITQEINCLSQASQEYGDSYAEQSKQMIYQFKQQLINNINSEEVQDIIGKIIKYGHNFDYDYSFGNLVSMYFQDSQATSVMSEGDWNKLNRELDTSKPIITIYLTTPSGKRIHNGADRGYVRDTMRSQGYHSVHIKRELNRRVDGKQYKATPHYDIRFTKVMAGRTDTYMNAARHQDAELKSVNNINSFYISIIAELFKKSYIELNDDSPIKAIIDKSATEQAASNNDLHQCIELYSRRKILMDYQFKNTNFYNEFIKNKNNRNIFDQQVAICTWIVMKYLGIDYKQPLAMASLKGVDSTNVTNVFDTVTNIATSIYQEIKSVAFMKLNNRTRRLKPVNGDLQRRKINENIINNMLLVKIFDGSQLADCYGYGDLYSKQRNLEESIIKNDFYEVLKQL